MVRYDPWDQTESTRVAVVEVVVVPAREEQQTGWQSAAEAGIQEQSVAVEVGTLGTEEVGRQQQEEPLAGRAIVVVMGAVGTVPAGPWGLASRWKTQTDL